MSKEITEVAPHASLFPSVGAALVQSVIWRRTDAFSTGTLEALNRYVMRRKSGWKAATRAFILATANPEHPYNADFLHRNLIRQPLPERDARWSIFLHEEWENGAASPVRRLLEWAWRDKGKAALDDEVVRLAATALAWFLTTPNRSLRDQATKALVALLEDKLHILERVLDQFTDVDDPYVSERLYAVAYGCAMRTREHEALRSLSQHVYDVVFRQGGPPVNILLRDYARGVVERALHLRLDIDAEPGRIRPPYGSSWPDASEIRTKEELEAVKEGWREAPGGGGRLLFYSVLGWGDFERYVIGTNNPYSKWSNRRLGEPKPVSLKERYTAFIATLTERQRHAFENYEEFRNLERARWPPRKEEGGFDEIFEKITDQPATNENVVSVREALERRVRFTLRKKKVAVFEESVLPYLHNPYISNSREDAFDLLLIQRFAFQRVLELGWTPERFSLFDGYVNAGDRRAALKPERVGKKYQWIALYEALARIADSFNFRGDPGSLDTSADAYEGPWQMSYVRNIDPSCLIDESKDDSRDEHPHPWWSLVIYDWAKAGDDVHTWLTREEDLPEAEALLEVVRPNDDSSWLMLQGSQVWKEPAKPLEEDGVEPPQREIFYSIESYLVARERIAEIMGWLREKELTWPETDNAENHTDLFLGEAYWSPLYLIEYKQSRRWREDLLLEGSSALLTPTCEHFAWSKSYDGASPDGFEAQLPALRLKELMGLTWDGDDARFVDPEGHTLAFDPSIQERGPASLLVSKQALVRDLAKADLALLWIVRGEKQILFDHPLTGGHPGWLYINGAFTLSSEGKVDGFLSTQHQKT